MALIQKIKDTQPNQEPIYVAYVKGEELKEIKVYFDGDDFSLYDKANKKFLKDENGYPFFGLDKAEELVAEFVSKLESIPA